MATEIRAIPTLFGEDAIRFERMAAEVENSTSKRNISEQVAMVENFLRKQNW